MDIGRCINEALEVYKKNLVLLFVAAVLFDLLSLLSLTILMGPLVGGWCLLTVNALRREDNQVQFGDLFGAFDRRFLRVCGLFYLTFLPILLGLLLCIAPGLLLMTMWIFCFFLVVDRDHGVFRSLAVSNQIVQRSGFGNYVLLVIIVLVISVVPIAIPYLGFIVGWFLTPLAWLIEAAAYVQETETNSDG